MKPKPRKPLKPTPASSPLAKACRLDRHGEPTHPEIVREPPDGAPWGSCPGDEFFDEEACAWVEGRDLGVHSTTYVFWYYFSDGELRGVHVVANTYAEAAQVVRTAPNGLRQICTWLCVTVDRLKWVDIKKPMSLEWNGKEFVRS